MISEKVAKAVEEQIRMFKIDTSEDRGITVEDYRQYLKLTEGQGEDLAPTEYIRKLRQGLRNEHVLRIINDEEVVYPER